MDTRPFKWSVPGITESSRPHPSSTIVAGNNVVSPIDGSVSGYDIWVEACSKDSLVEEHRFPHDSVSVQAVVCKVVCVRICNAATLWEVRVKSLRKNSSRLL